jgi:cellobiose phosphorylase
MGTLEKYGRFIQDECCFELTSEPPRKWRNIHYNQCGPVEYYVEATHIGDGQSRVRFDDGMTMELVGYDCKYIYIRDEETGEVFTPAGVPGPNKVDDYSCRFYPEKTVICSTFDDLRVSWRIFVPRTELFEAWTCEVENLSGRPRKLSVFSYATMPMRVSSEQGLYQRGVFSSVHPEESTVVVHNRDIINFPKGVMRGYMTSLNDSLGVNGYREHLTRADYSLSTTRLLDGWNCDNRPGIGPDCAGIIQVGMELGANESDRADFLIGHCDDLDEVKALRARLSPEKLDELCDEQAAVERANAAMFTVDTGEENKNRDALINLFVKKQMYSYLVDKSGFRDNLQNDCGMAMFDYPTVRANFLRALSSQKPSGEVLHGFRPFNRKTYADKPAWILMTVPWLIKESGDVDLLKEVVPYFESDEEGTVWEHVQRTIRYMANDTGKRGLSSQHFADWNDGLEPSPETGERESVMVSQQFCFGCLEIAELADRIGDKAVAEECRTAYKTMAEAINTHAWDGQWYVRTICEDGYALGSDQHEEAKIFLNTQSWAIISKVAEGDRAAACLQAVDERCTKPEGYVVCDPPLYRYDKRIGRFSANIPLTNTNGGCYCHASGFKAFADCLMKRPEEAWQTYVRAVPDNPENPISRSGAEPFSFTNKYDLSPEAPGASGYAWRTGTASWFTMVLIEGILGIRRGYDGLVIDPCLTKKVPTAKVKRTFRGAIYEIEIDNTAGRCTGTTSIVVDGEEIAGNVLPLFDGGTHTVQVVI